MIKYFVCCFGVY